MNIKSKLVYNFLFVCIIASLMLGACSGSVSGGIQLPGTPSDNSSGGAQEVQNNTTLIYVLIGAVVLVALVALMKK
jgi:hypothetical protein